MKIKFAVAVSTIAAVVFTGLVATPAFAVVPDCAVTITTNGVTVDGTNTNDVFCLDADDVAVNLLGGDDTVVDRGVGNTIFLGDGNDTSIGAEGEGQTVDGGAGADAVTGTPGADEITGGEGDDTLIGGDGDDTVNGGLGADQLQGEAGNDDLSGEAGSDDVDGGDGGDTVNGGDGVDTLSGDVGDDVIDGGEGDDVLEGGAGSDDLSGEAGGDDVVGGDGGDTLDGGEGDDSLIAGEGDDTVNGGGGADELAGDAGADSLYGESGTDTLQGGDGDDVLAGGPDIDTLNGGGGINMCDYQDGETLTSTCTYDDVGPVVSPVTFSPSTVDVGSSSATTRMTFTVTDATGIDQGYIPCGAFHVVFNRLETGWTSYWFDGVKSNYFESTPITDGGKSFTFDQEVTIPFGTAPGVRVCGGDARDSLANRSGFNDLGSLTVNRTGEGFDDVGPVVSPVTFSPSTVDVGSSSATTRMTFTVTDATGIDQGYIPCGAFHVVFNRLETGWTSYWFDGVKSNYFESTPITDGGKSFTFDQEVTIPFGTAPGVRVCGGDARDSLANRSGFNDLGSLTVNRTGEGFDDVGPVVSPVTFSPSTVDVGSSSATTRMTFTVTDATGIDQGYIPCGAFHVVFNRLETGWTSYWFDGVKSNYFESTPITDGGKSFTFDQEVTIPFGTAPGVRVCGGDARDSLANRSGFNDLGSLTVFRTPAGQPSVPVLLGFVADRATSGVLSWGVPAVVGSPVLTGYVAQMSLDGTSWRDVPGGVTSGRSVRVSGLSPDTEYWFRVRGENGGTAGQDTTFMNLKWAVVKVRTPAPTVAQAPRVLRVSGVSSSGFTLGWSAPAYDGGAAVTDFSVETSRDNGATWVSVKSGVSTSQSVKVTGAAPGTRYLVRVAAVNAVGAGPYLSGEVTTAQSVPSAPQNLTVPSVTGSSAVLNWALPASNGGTPITDYRVEVSRDGTSWTVVPRPVSVSRYVRVTGLAPGTAYQVRVAAVNAIGVGPATAGSLTTLPVVPSAPQNLAVSGVTGSSAVLGWALPVSNGGAAITDYRVEVSRDGVTWTVVPRAVSTSRYVRVTGMAPGTTYRVRVAAVNTVGVGPYLSGEVTTAQAVPSAPQNLAVSSVTSSSVVLSWALPVSNGGSPITDYRVEASRDGGVTWLVVPRPVSVSRYVRITGMAPGTAYLVRVAAINAIGVGPAVGGSVTTLPVVPSAPQNLTVGSVTSSSAVLSWALPASNGGSPITDYRVEASRDSGVTWTVVPRPVSTSRYVRITGMAPGTTYQVRVAAINMVGVGPAAAGTVTTTAVAPSAPLNLAVSNVTGSSLSLAWDLPASNGGSPITDYTIQVSSNCSTYTAIAHPASTGRGFNVTGLAAGTRYCFRVAAVNAVGTSAPSTVVPVVTVGNVPSAPVNLAVQNLTATSFTLSWQRAAVTGGSPVRNYLVDYSTDDGATWTPVTKPASTSTTLAINAILPHTGYLYRVTAVNDVGPSPTSTPLHIATQ